MVSMWVGEAHGPAQVTVSLKGVCFAKRYVKLRAGADLPDSSLVLLLCPPP